MNPAEVHAISREQLVAITDAALAKAEISASGADRARLIAATHSRVAFGDADVQGCGCMSTKAIRSLHPRYSAATTFPLWPEASRDGWRFIGLAHEFDVEARYLTRSAAWARGVLEVTG